MHMCVCQLYLYNIAFKYPKIGILVDFLMAVHSPFQKISCKLNLVSLLPVLKLIWFVHL